MGWMEGPVCTGAIFSFFCQKKLCRVGRKGFIEGELLPGDSIITVAGFDVIPLQALKILPPPCCSHMGYVGTKVGTFLTEIDVGIDSAFNENLCT